MVVIAIDAGTTGIRSVAIDDAGTPIASAYREFTQHFPVPGWVEHDATEIWETTLTTLGELIDGLTEPIAAIGITNQRETAVVWDRRTGAPRHRAIVWQDRRTAARCEELEAAGHLPLVREQTGLVLDPYFTGSKLEWLFTEGDVSVDDDLAVGTVDSWLIWNLTAGASHVTDVTNASRTLLFDIRSMRWSEELTELFGVPGGALPEVRPSSGRFGTTAEGLSIPPGLPISGVAGDQQAALFGQACVAPGDAKNTYGTGSFVLLNVGEDCPPPTEGLLTTVAWTLDHPGGGSTTHYALEGAIFVTGAAVQWLRDALALIDDAAALEALAGECDDTGGVVIVPAFTGLGSPWWDPYARGIVAGLTRGSGRPQFARAVVESMVHQTRDVVDAMTAASGQPLGRLRVDGGASVMDLLCQLQADQLQVTVDRPVVKETTSQGAAYLAGLAEGVWSSPAEVADRWQLEARFEPGGDHDALEAAHQQWHRAVERSRDWARPE